MVPTPTALRGAFFAAAVLFSASAASAQDNQDYRVRVGLGGQIRPDYLGADSSEWAPLWKLSVAKGDDIFAFSTPGDSFGIKVYSKDGFSFGPAANLASGRSRSDTNGQLDKVSTTIEVGAFAQYMVGESVRLRADLLKGVNGHKGLVASLGADKIWRDGDAYVFSIGPRLLLSDSRYQRAWFGVDADDAITSGLPLYRPDGGIHAVGATSSALYQLSPQFGLFGYGKYERLVGDAAKSPVVRELGSKNQFSAGLGLTYTFTIRR